MEDWYLPKYLNFMKKLIYILIINTILLISGCTVTENLLVTPDSLPDATVGKPYFAKIIIHTNGGNIGSFNAPIMPSNSGLTTNVCDPNDSSSNALSCIVVQGTPNQLTEIKVNVSGSITPSHGVLYKVRNIFNKTYTITVKESK